MSHLANITKKELRELLTPGSLIPVVMVAVIFMFMGSMIGGEVEKASAPVVIGIADADDGVYSDLSIGYIETFYETYYKVPVEDLPEYLITLDSSIYGNDQAILQEMRAKGVTTLLFFGPGFSEDIASKEQATIELYFSEVSTGAFGNMSSPAMTGIISYVNTSLSTELLEDGYGVPPEEVGAVLNPIGQTQPVTFINGVAYTGITPYEISSAMSSQSMSVPIMIMLIIVMIGSIVISSMGNEKENKTLETLLTLPVDRTTIVSGKLIASAMAGLIYGLIYMVGMYFYTDGLAAGGSMDLSKYGLSLGGLDWLIILVSMFLGIICALGMCMVLGAFAKNYKAAQTMTMPISMLAVVPMFVMIFTSYGDLPGILQGVIFAIPFSHPMMAMQNLMFGDMTLVAAGLVYMALFALAMIYITVRIYRSDILITGFTKEDFKRMFSMKGRRGAGRS